MELTVVEPVGENIAGKIAARLEEYGGKPGEILIRSLSSMADLQSSKPDILVLPAGGALAKSPLRSSCGILLLPGDADADGVHAECVVTYGMSPKNSITLSSISEEMCVLALQRELITAKRDVLERQEFKIKGGMRPEALMVVTGALLLAGYKPPDINR